jgi:H+/Cl- antiporter ClcA
VVLPLITTGYITLYNQGIKFFGQHSVFLFNINFWPLILLGIAGVFIGLAIKFFGQQGGLGVAQTQYAQTGCLNYRNLPSILLQGFIALWSGAAVGPEGTLVFLTGGLGTFVSERLKLQKDDVQVLVYSAIAGAFGGFFGSPIIGAVGAVEYMFIKELNLYRHLIPGLIAYCKLNSYVVSIFFLDYNLRDRIIFCNSKPLANASAPQVLHCQNSYVMSY